MSLHVVSFQPKQKHKPVDLTTERIMSLGSLIDLLIDAGGVDLVAVSKLYGVTVDELHRAVEARRAEMGLNHA